MNRFHLGRLLAVLLGLAMVAAACGSSSDESDDETSTDETTEETTATETDTGSDDEDEDEMEEEVMEDRRISTYIGQPQTLTPINNNESEGKAVLASIFTPLMEFDPATNDPFLSNAESIETADNQNYTVVLKDGWTFHNGEAVTAESYVRAWNYAAYGPNAQEVNGFFASVEGYDDLQCGKKTETNDDGDDIEVADCEEQPPASEELAGLKIVSDNEFTIGLSSEVPYFLTQIADTPFSPLPSVFYDDPIAFDRAPIGNGPFMMNGEWEDDVQILVDAYPDYQGTPVSIPGIEFRIYGDVNTAVTDLVAGELDIVDGVPPEQWASTIAEVPNYDTSASSSINYMGFPVYQAPFDNVDMRAALSMAIDRSAITEGIFEGLRQPANNLLAPVIPGYQETVCDEWTFNPELAQARFEAAGGLDAIGDSMNVWFNEGGGHDQWMNAVLTMWEQNLGIPASSVTFQNLPFAEYLDVADNADFTGPFRLGWGMDYPHPQNYLELLLTLTAEEGGYNSTFWKDDDYTAKVNEANAESDLLTSIGIWQEAAELACTNVPLAPMFYGQNSFAWNDGVGGVQVDAFGRLVYSELTLG